MPTLTSNLSRPASGSFVVVDGGRGGEPTKTMTADTITLARIDDLRAALSAAVDSMANLWHDVSEGEITTEEAAAIVNETIQNLTNEAR